MIIIRSVVFNVLFYLVLVPYLMVAMPTLLLPRWGIIRLAQHWGRVNLHLLRIVCGITVEWRGLEKIPAGACLVAAKHQSVWETFALLTLFPDPAYILKRELLWIPVFGLFLLKADMIAVDRSAGGRALIRMTRRAGEAVRRGRQLVIFPEGTRTAVGAPPRYKAGVGQVYVDSGVACLPVALNSGLFWPRRTFMRYPGTLVVEFLDLLPPGLSRDQFLTRAREVIEDASNRLVEAGRAEQAQLFGRVPGTAKA